MATAPLGHIKIHVGTLCIERRQLAFLQARCEETDLKFPEFLADLLDAQQNAFHEFLRSLIAREKTDCDAVGWKLRPASVLPPKGSSSEEPPMETDGRRRDTQTTDTKCRIIAFLLAGGKVPTCAQRFNTSASTIRRVKKEGMPSPQTVQKILFLHTRHYDGVGPGHGVQAIAEAVGVSEVIVEAIISNHKPLVQETTAIYAHPPRPGGWDRQMSRI